MREREVENALERACDRRGVWCVRFVLVGRAGFPDRMLLAPGGRIAFVELKRPGGSPERLQGWVHSKLRRLGFLVAVIDRPDDCEPFLLGWLGAEDL